MGSESFDGNSTVLRYARDMERLYPVLTVPIVIHDRWQRIVSLNSAMCQLVGLDVEEVKGKRCQEVGHRLNISSHSCPFLGMDAASDSCDSCEVYVPVARSYYLITRYPIFNDNDEHVGGVCMFNKIHRARRSNQPGSSARLEQLESLLDAQTDVMCWKDGEGRWQYLNESGRRFFRIEEKDYLGKTDFEIAAGNVLFRLFFTKCISLEEEAWSSRQPVTSRINIDHSCYRSSTFEVTKVPFFNQDGSRKGMAGIAWDITRIVTTEKELHAAINQLNIILNNISSAIALVIDRKLVWTNPAAERLFGYSAGEFHGCSTEILYPSREAFEEFGTHLYLELVRKGYSRGEVRLRKKDGNYIWCLYSASFVNAKDPSQGIIVAIEDIQAQKDAWRREQELQEKMQHAQKLESLGVLAGGIAHDFNNLLMGIMGNTELCLMKLAPDSPLRTYIERVRRASKKAADLTAQMLAYSGKGHFIIEAVNLSNVVREMSELLDSVISKKARLVFRLADELPSVKGDVSQMRQVVMNLLVNASEALEDRPGDIVVSTGVMEVDSYYLQKVYFDHDAPPGKYVWLEVSDTGSGMDSQTVARIFEPFFTTKFSGRGLGLAALLGIVRGHHGIISVDSEPGRGTSVRVLFPVFDDMQKRLLEKGTGCFCNKHSGIDDQAVTEVDEGQVLAIAGHRILVVDDEKEVRDVARRLLESFGCSVITAIAGLEAVKVFSDEHQRIDAVLLDLTMPDMGGAEVLRHMRSIDANACIVLSSGNSEEESLEEMGKGAVDGFIHKPYGASELVSCLSKALGKRAEETEKSVS